jgi:hypothetical protein
MKFECGDLERALANPDLMPEAHKHLADCATCRNEYRLWNEISSAAKQLHCEWDSPSLWPNIRASMEMECDTPRPWWMEWKTWTAAATAAAVILLAILLWPQTVTLRATDKKATVAGRDFLTEQALRDVERNETAYRRSIEDLSRLAQPKLESGTSASILVSYKEKLLMLDSAILETRSNVAQNRFNVSLQTELADLYREKRHTLQEVLTYAQQN